MLRHTFVHLAGVGIKTEKSLWDLGIQTWDDFLDPACSLPFGKGKCRTLRAALIECNDHICSLNAEFFARSLPSSIMWRLYSQFRDCAAYIDIETTGLGGPYDYITTAALYDGREIHHYVHSDNLDQFAEDLGKYKLLITYNGSCFDLPFIRNFFGIRLDQAHIDLRFLLNSLGYRGGLKGCERQLGICRDDLDGVDGYFAVILWHEYKKTGNPAALETLLAYNIADAVNLETLMVAAFNLKVGETPFPELALHAPCPPQVPFRADPELICDLRRRYFDSDCGGLILPTG